MNTKTIVYFGDSLTAGYGLTDSQSYPALLQDQIIKARLDYDYLNAGLSGDTTVSALLRLNQVIEKPFDIFVLALGANDMLRFHPAELIYRNLLEIVQKVILKNPTCKILLLGMELPPWFKLEAAAVYQNIYSKLANEMHLTLVPALLADVFGKATYNLPDRIHPNAAGYRLIAQRIWPTLQSLLST